MLILHPRPETLHSALTADPIDLSDAMYKGKSFTRAKLLRFIASILTTNPNVHSFFFKRTGTLASLYLVDVSKTISRVDFTLESQSPFNPTTNSYDKLTIREYLQSMLNQEIEPVRVDYLGYPDFVYY